MPDRDNGAILFARYLAWLMKVVYAQGGSLDWLLAFISAPQKTSTYFGS